MIVSKYTLHIMLRTIAVMRQRANLFYISGIIGICLFYFGYPLPISGFQSDDIAVVVPNRLHMRAEPDINSTSRGVLRKGTRVFVLEHDNGWIRILHDDKTGYVRNREKYVRLLKQEKKNRLPASGSDMSVDQAKKEVEDIRLRIEASKKAVKSFARKEMDTINSLDEIDLALYRARKQVAGLRKELTSLEVNMNAVENEIKILKASIKTTEAYATKRLVALYKLGWLGQTPVYASAESISDLFYRVSALERIHAFDELALQALQDNKMQHQQLLKEQNAQIGEKRSLETALESHVHVLSQKKTERSTLLASIRNKKALKLASIKALELAAAALNEKIEALSVEDPPKRPENGMMPIAFSSFKGLLNMPVKGKIIHSFGPYKHPEFNVMNFRSGIDIKTDRGEPVQAVCSGTVLFASWFKGYGNMIIIDHGENYYTLYANIEEFFKTKGDRVEMGEVVATVGDTGSRIGPKLYFEVRHHGKPVNPLIWVKRG